MDSASIPLKKAVSILFSMRDTPVIYQLVVYRFNLNGRQLYILWKELSRQVSPRAARSDELTERENLLVFWGRFFYHALGSGWICGHGQLQGLCHM